MFLKRKNFLYIFFLFFAFLFLNFNSNEVYAYSVSVDGVYKEDLGYEFYLVNDDVITIYLDEEIFLDENVKDIVIVETNHAHNPLILSRGSEEFKSEVIYEMKNKERELKNIGIILLKESYNQFMIPQYFIQTIDLYVYQVDNLSQNSFFVQVHQGINENEMFDASIYFSGERVYALDSIHYIAPNSTRVDLDVSDREFEINQIGVYQMFIMDVFGNEDYFLFLVGFDFVDQILIENEGELEQTLGIPLEVKISLDLLTQGISVINNIDQNTTVQWFVNGNLVESKKLNEGGGIFYFTPPSSERKDIRSHSISARILNRTSNSISLFVSNNQRPVVSLIGDNPLFIEAGVTLFSEMGASAIDDVDGNISSDVIIDYRAFGIEGLNIIVQSQLSEYEHLFEDVNKTLGSFYVNYYVYDSHQNMSLVNRRQVIVQDTLAPEIILNGEEEIQILFGSEYIDEGAVAIDAFEGDISEKLIIQNYVNTLKVGEQLVVYRVRDASNNEARKERIVRVIDDEPPFIELIGEENITVEYRHTYIERGARVSDNVDGNFNILPYKITRSSDGVLFVEVDKVDTNILGEYKLFYNYTDTSFNEGNEVIRNVYVVNTTPPRIEVLIKQPYILFFNTSNIFSLTSGIDYRAFDVDNNDISDIVVLSGSVSIDTNDPNNIGLHLIYLNVEDNDGNQAEEKSVVVYLVDTTNPIAILKGANNIFYEARIDSINVGDYYKDGEYGFDIENLNEEEYEILLDIYFNDVLIGSRISLKALTSRVNTNSIGTYRLSYVVKTPSRESDPSVVINRFIHIQDTTPPVINFIGGDEVRREVNTSLTTLLEDLKKNTYVSLWDAYDSYYGNEITLELIDYVDMNRIGEYSVFYRATDTNGNSSLLKERKIIIEDTTPPIIELIGEENIFVERGSSYSDQGARLIDSSDGSLIITSLFPCSDNWQENEGLYGCYSVLRRLDGQSQWSTSSMPNGFNRGIYQIIYHGKDSSGNLAISVVRNVVVEATLPPIVSGIDEDKYYYNENFTITFEDPRGTDAVYTAYLNGELVVSPVDISVDGFYTLLVIDDFGNEFYYEFVLDKTPPKVLGVVDGEHTNRNSVLIYGDKELSAVEYLYEEDDWVLIEDKNATFVIEGNYQVRVRDLAGNYSSIVRFTIDMQPPLIFHSFEDRTISDRRSGEYLSALERDLTIKINNQIIEEDSFYFEENNFYKIEVSDKAGNIIERQFTLNRQSIVDIGEHKVNILYQTSLDSNNRFIIPKGDYPQGYGFVIVYPRANDSFEFIEVRAFKDQNPNELLLLLERDIILNSNINTNSRMAVVFIIDAETVELLTPKAEDVNPFLILLLFASISIIFYIAIRYRRNIVTTSLKEEFEFEEIEENDYF